MRISLLALLGLFLISALPAQAADWDCASDAPAAGTSGQPTPVDKPFWKPTFDGQVALAKLKAPRVVMLGDSQFEWWPGQLWQKDMAPIGALNFGVHSDKTENLLWRFENAGPDVWRSPAYVILIGTNNISLGDSAQLTADGVRVLLNSIKAHAPNAKVLIVGILPREHSPNDWVQKAVAQTNGYLAGCQSRPGVTYINLNDLLQTNSGDSNDGIADDKIHLTQIGYERITPPLLAAIAKMLSSAKTSSP